MKKPIVISGISTTPKNVPSLSEEAPPVVVGIPSKDQSAAYAQEAKTAAELAEKYAEEASQTSQEAVEIHNTSPDAHSTLFSQKLTTPEGGLPGQVLVKTEEGEGWGDVSSTSIGGVSGDINLSDGLEIDSETKTMGIGNASVQSLTIADGGITQDIDVSLGGKAFFIGKNTTPVTGSNYYFAYQFSHGGAYLQAKRIDIGGRIYNATVAIMGDVNFFDGRVNISDRATSFTCHSPTATFASATTFNGTTIFNNDVTAAVIRPQNDILHIGNYANLYDPQYANKSYLNIENSGVHANISAGFFDGNGNRQVAQIHFNSTVWFHKTLASDSIIWAQGEFWSGKLAKFKGSFLTYEEGLAKVDLIDSAGRQILFLDNSEATPTLRIGSRTGSTDETKNAREVSIFSRNSGMWSSGGGWFFKGRLFDSTTSTRYTLTGTPEVINATWTFNADIVNSTGVFRVPDGVTAKLGDYVEAPTVADANKVWFELGKYTDSNATLTAYRVNASGFRTPTSIRLGSAGDSSIAVLGNFINYGSSTMIGGVSFQAGVTRTTKLNPLPEDVMNKQMVDTAIADAGGHTTIDGVAGDILLSDGITIDPDTKTLGLGDIVADSVNLPNADSSATINGSILSGSHGVNRIALLNAYGIGLISSVPEYNQLAIGGDKVLDIGYGRCVDRLSLLALGCGINLMLEGIFVNGAMWKGTSGGKGRYLASKENESVSGDWTFNANVIFNSSISNITGVYKTGKGTKICLGDYVQTPTVADAGKRFLEITNQSSASLATEFSTKVVTSTGSFSSETYSVFKDSFLEGNSITANVNLLVKGASTLRGVSTFNGAVIANAGLTNTTGIFLLPNKQNRFGQYVENPTIDDASKGWLMLEHSVNTGIDVTLYAEYVSSTGSVAGGQIRFGSAVVCNTSLLVFDNVDFRSTLRVGGDIRALAGTIITPMSTAPTRIGDYVANPSTADAGKLWIEISKKDGYIELSGKEVVNTNGTVSVQNYPVRVPGMIRYEELTEAEFAALSRPLPGDVIYRTTQN